MSKTHRCLCLLALLAAVGLSVFLVSGLFRLRADLSAVEQALALSRAAWEDTAERKEALQEELSVVTDALKEAALTLSESESRAEELRADIAQLQSDLSSLTSALTQRGIDPAQSQEETP